MSRARNLFLLLGSAVCVAGSAVGFTLFGYPNATDIQNGQYNKWVRQPARTPFTLTYKVDPQFLQNQAPGVAAEARNAAVRALNSWSQWTNAFIEVQEETRWVGTVPNANPLPPRWEGPPGEEWLANQAYFQSLGIVPGWGANIEVFSRPNGFMITSQSYPTFVMSPAILGFTIVNRQAGRIVSADIYLNESRTDWFTSTDQPGGMFDIESVVLHELGHALGLDHPNQAAQFNSVNLNPYTFASGQSWCTCDVMHGAYTGVKRVLTNDESGAMAFLYQAGAGDLNGDGLITMVDVARAIALAESASQPRPYDLHTMDFIDGDGQIGVAELAYMLQWATGGLPYTPGGPALRSLTPVTPVDADPATITLTIQPGEPDIGKGGEIDIAVRIQNPDAVPVLAWGFNFQYDSAVLTNPRCADGDFPDNSLKITNLTNDGSLEISNIAAVADASTSGLLLTFTFDINLPAAALVTGAAFTLMNPSMVVNVGGQIRDFGTMAGEVLVIQNATVGSSDFDVNNDNSVDLTDLYAWHQAPTDVNRDSMMNDTDRRSLSDCLRRGETADILPPARQGN